MILWVNLQNALGTLGTFLPAMKNGNVGWFDIPQHILAGQQIDSETPCEVQSDFYGIGRQVSGLLGGWLWNLEDFGSQDYNAWDNAIRQGLGGNNCT